MTVEEVRERVRDMAAASGDNEHAHGLQDDLYVEVLTAIAQGAENAQELADAALAAREVEFTRWYA